MMNFSLTNLRLPTTTLYHIDSIRIILLRINANLSIIRFIKQLEAVNAATNSVIMYMGTGILNGGY
jgi:hypothetical protein